MAERKANVRWQQTARKIQAVGAMKQNLSFAQVKKKILKYPLYWCPRSIFIILMVTKALDLYSNRGYSSSGPYP